MSQINCFMQEERLIMDIEKVYLKLLDEGVDVYTPVNAEKIDNFFYKILDDDRKAYEKFLEKWEFKTGDIVRCKTKKLSIGKKKSLVLVAIERKNIK